MACFGQAVVRVEGQGDVHVLLHGLKRHEDGGKVVGRLEAGEHGGLDRHVAAEGGEALVVPCVSAHRDAVGGHVQAGLGALLERDAESAGAASGQDADIAFGFVSGLGYGEHDVPDFLDGAGQGEGQPGGGVGESPPGAHQDG